VILGTERNYQISATFLFRVPITSLPYPRYRENKLKTIDTLGSVYFILCFQAVSYVAKTSIGLFTACIQEERIGENMTKKNNNK